MTAPTDILGAGEGDYELVCRITHLHPEVQEGDSIVARPQATAEDGQMVVALVDDVATITRAPLADGQIIGLVLGLYRSVK